MADTTDTGAAPEGATGEPAGAPAQADTALGAGGLAALQTEREARKAAEKQLADLEARVKAFEDEKLSATEKAERDAADYKAKYEQLTRETVERDAREAISAEAAKAGAVSPAAVARLANLAEYDPAKGAGPTVAALRKSYPELFRPTGSADTAQRGGAHTGSFNDTLRKQLWG